MYRNVILDFVSTNQLTLLENQYTQMTLVLFSPNDKNLSSLLKAKEELTIYHVKGHYTFQKKYGINFLENSIVEMVLEYNDRIKLLKEEISFSINDPYYLKDIREQKFTSIELVPVLEKESLVGVVLIYSDNVDSNVKISNQKWLTFINKLNVSVEEKLQSVVINDIVADSNLYSIVINNNKDIYINDNLKKDYKLDSNILYAKDKSYNLILRLTYFMKKIEKDNYVIYYLEKNLLIHKEQNIDILNIDSINNNGFKDEFSLIFTKAFKNETVSIMIEKFDNVLKQVVPTSVIKYYQVSKSSIVIILNKALKKKEENELLYLLKKGYYLVINSKTDIPLKTNLIEVVEYLDEVMPDSFNYAEYNNYLNELNKQKFNCDNPELMCEKLLVKADNNDILGTLVNGVLNNYYHKSIYKVFEISLIEQMERSIKKRYDNPIFTVLISSIKKRKILELLKKIASLYTHPKLIVHVPVINNYSTEEVYQSLEKIKSLGFVVIVDSTIFMKLEYMICIRIIDAILIRKNEFEYYITDFTKTMLDEYYNDGKVIIYEDMVASSLNYPINDLTCVLIERNKYEKN